MGYLPRVPHDNVETVKRIHERWERERAFDPSDFHPTFELRTPMLAMEGKTRRGRDGFEAWRAANTELYAEEAFEADGYRALDDGAVVVTGRLRLKGRSSGVETCEALVQLWTFADGKASSVTTARTLEEALEAAGVRGRSLPDA